MLLPMMKMCAIKTTNLLRYLSQQAGQRLYKASRKEGKDDGLVNALAAIRTSKITRYFSRARTTGRDLGNSDIKRKILLFPFLKLQKLAYLCRSRASRASPTDLIALTLKWIATISVKIL